MQIAFNLKEAEQRFEQDPINPVKCVKNAYTPEAEEAQCGNLEEAQAFYAGKKVEEESKVMTKKDLYEETD